MIARLSLSKSIYPESCIDDAVKAFREFGRVARGESNEESFDLELEPLANIDPVTLRYEFLNYLLELSVERHLQRR